MKKTAAIDILRTKNPKAARQLAAWKMAAIPDGMVL
jgi:hypothetical protein